MIFWAGLVAQLEEYLLSIPKLCLSIKATMVTHACDPTTVEMKAEGSGMHGYHWLYFEAHLTKYMTLSKI